MTVILGAMDGEIAAIRDGMGPVQVGSWQGYEIVRGVIAGEPVVLCRTGVGKTLSALVCQHLVETYRPDRVIFTGVAGSLAGDLEIGDTIVGRDAIQHDMDATPLGMAPGEIPYSGYRVIPCDPTLVAIAARVEPKGGSARIGRILTGDQFVTSPERRRELRDRFGGDCVEMEGASVALVCAVNKTPCVLIRTISDHADGTDDFQRALSMASANAWNYVASILSSLEGNDS